jgi:hypothetical protein
VRRILAAAAAAAPPEAAAYRDRLQHILARREFRAAVREGQVPELDVPEMPSFLNWLAVKFGELWDRLVAWLRGWRPKDPDPSLPGGGGVLAGALSEPLALALGLLAVALLVVILLRYRRRSPSATDEAALMAAAPSSHAMPDALARPADAWARFAEEFRRKGEWRLALRAVYLRILVVLHERGAIRYERQRTNGDYQAALAAGPAGEPFARLTAAFDEAWYGNKPFGESAFRQAVEWTRAVDRATAPQAEGP